VPVGGGERHDGVERPLEAAAVLAACALGQATVPARQRHGGQRQRLQARGEDGVARLDGEAAVAQPMHDPNAIGVVRFAVPVPFAGAGLSTRRRRSDAHFP
jgi:hypothetical protein